MASGDSAETPAPRIQRTLIIGIALLAPALAGSTQRWSQAIVLIALAALFIFWPPRRSAGVTFQSVALALVALAAMSFLPHHWFYVPAWRTTLVDDFSIALPQTLTVQPWITLESFALLVAGLAWISYLAAQTWSAREREWLAKSFCAGIFALTVVALAAFLLKFRLWESQRGFGPFPNRNQTGNLLGITAIVVLAVAHHDLRRGKWTWLPWSGGLALLIAGLIANYSRAGIAILFVGCAVWCIAQLRIARSRPGLAIGISAVLGMMALFLAFGGETLERFRTGIFSTAAFRWQLNLDSLALVRASPWCGIGLGNFEPVFGFSRVASAVEDVHAIHPESDWAWLAVEMGWLGVVLVAAACVLLARRILPLTSGTLRGVRLAAAIAAAAFVAHGFADVSGHRMGSAFPALFLFSLALMPERNAAARRRIPLVFRFVGVALGLAGTTWLCFPNVPGWARAEALKHAARAAAERRAWSETINSVTQALVWVPLDWKLYFQRGAALATSDADWRAAAQDFRRARFLEPLAASVPFAEANVWLHVRPELAVDAWEEALRRTSRRRDYYASILSNGSGITALQPRLRKLADQDVDLLLAFLSRASAEEFATEAQTLLARDPRLNSLTSQQRRTFFAAWSQRDQSGAIPALLKDHPEWLPDAWLALAHYHAKCGEYQRAYEVARPFVPESVVPHASSPQTADEVQRRVLSNPSDFAAVRTLYTQFLSQGRLNEALPMIRAATAQSGCPRWLHFLEAELSASREDWERAWRALERCAASDSSQVGR